MPSDETRDLAINEVMSAAAVMGEFDASLLAAYSNERARQQGASTAIVQLGHSDLARARALLNLHVTDAALRHQTEEQLARAGGTGRAARRPFGNTWDDVIRSR